MWKSIIKAFLYIILISVIIILYGFDIYNSAYLQGLEGKTDEYVKEKYNSQIEQESKLNCEGIEYYYTGDFWGDYYYLKRIYNLKYNATNNGDFLKEPKELLNKDYHGDFDCEDFSYIVKCLSKIYNKSCEYYIYVEYSGLEKEVNRHLGIECDVNGFWENLN